jgi:hypothetical protein
MRNTKTESLLVASVECCLLLGWNIYVSTTGQEMIPVGVGVSGTVRETAGQRLTGMLQFRTATKISTIAHRLKTSSNSSCVQTGALCECFSELEVAARQAPRNLGHAYCRIPCLWTVGFRGLHFKPNRCLKITTIMKVMCNFQYVCI